MTENQLRNTEISRRKEEKMSAVEAIRNEMSASVKALGGEGNVLSQVYRASRLTGLSETVVERLRWKKIRRVPTDISDAVRIALENYNEAMQRRIEHENEILKERNAALKATLAATHARLTVGSSDPEFDEVGAKQIAEHFQSMDG